MGKRGPLGPLSAQPESSCFVRQRLELSWIRSRESPTELLLGLCRAAQPAAASPSENMPTGWLRKSPKKLEDRTSHFFQTEEAIAGMIVRTTTTINIRNGNTKLKVSSSPSPSSDLFPSSICTAKRAKKKCVRFLTQPTEQ
ncbi:hypothetical protein H920_15417 [Fukomys damarensis]|uniref:Uncharacterized protein n=1 Tax=Fukomys damarensis TaxID=885580 RepID=A0A091CX44_FUKDA|nr:hypothetical protein H920_15417 [Fukomys damarensis]